jgi:glycogen operon protein
VDPDAWAQERFPLGARLDGNTTTFAVFSRRATRVLLEIYDQALGRDAVHDYWLAKNPDDHVWRARVEHLPAGTLYAFRCWGPNFEYAPEWTRGGSLAGFHADVDAAGNRFNPNKLLFDPYTREITHDPESRALADAGLDARLYWTGPFPYLGRPSRELDTAHWAPKGIVIADTATAVPRPYLPPEEAIIYEAHLRGLTRHPSASRLRECVRSYPGFDAVMDVPEAERGTFAGAARMAPYLKALGFTTLELLPVQETQNEQNPEDRPGGNFWGYMTHAYFALDRRYAFDRSPGGPTREFRELLEAFHKEGLEVYLDVVYNHSGEGGNCLVPDGHGGLIKHRDVTAFTSLGGFDAAEYYVRTADNFLDDGATGTGNQLDFSSPVARQLVLDSLRSFIERFGVDGFRFDLAPVLGRLPNTEVRGGPFARRFFSEHPLLVAVRDLGLVHDVEMIAEAWDLWGYEVGNFPAHWGEWNGRFRDSVRRFLLGRGNAPELADMMNGDYSHFASHGGAQRSINFVVAHDGFTLADLVSYSEKTNTRVSWPFGPSDGGQDQNDSWHWDGNAALRRQQIRNAWTLLVFARGVPMALYGDELGRTQNGNNNPWNVDGAGTYTNYSMLRSRAPQRVPTEAGGAYHDNLGEAGCEKDRNFLFPFVRALLNLRRSSRALRQRRYANEVLDDGVDVTYLFRREDGVRPLEAGNRCVWLRIDGSGAGDREGGGEPDFLLFLNFHDEPVDFALPSLERGRRWCRLIDTAAWAEPWHNVWPEADATDLAESYQVHPFSVVVARERRMSPHLPMKPVSERPPVSWRRR